MLTRRSLLSLLGYFTMERRTTRSSAPQPVVTRLLLGGDVMLSRHVGRLARIKRDPASPLRDLAPVLQSADIAFVNLEAPFSDRGPLVEQGMLFKAEPEMIAALELAGIDVVSTANNHARDCGSYGVEFTLDWLARHKIAVTGTAHSSEQVHAGTVLERNGVRFGFLAYTYDQSNGNHTDTDDRVAGMDVKRMASDVKSLRSRTDVVVVSMHAGEEYSPNATGRQIEFAHAAIEAGARVVAGHHPHVTQPWEKCGAGVIFYSLGNLVFDQFQRAETQRGALAEVVFEGKVLVRAGILPVDIIQTAPRLAVVGPSGPFAGLPKA